MLLGLKLDHGFQREEKLNSMQHQAHPTGTDGFQCEP